LPGADALEIEAQAKRRLADEFDAAQADENIAEWIKITDRILSQSAKEINRGRGQPEGGVTAAARDLGVDKDDAHRAVKVAVLSDEAKDAARSPTRSRNSQREYREIYRQRARISTKEIHEARKIRDAEEKNPVNRRIAT
jgi:ParB family chromosome partitioning protein